jgi:hypothetical protein
MKHDRAFVLFKSGGKINLLDPDPQAWTEDDLAMGLSRTYRWAGHSRWPLPLSVAQHSLTVLTLAELMAKQEPLTAREKLRELLHDAVEGFYGFDCITTLKPHLGPGFAALDRRLQATVDLRYKLPAWTEDSYKNHKFADRLAAASEAYHVVGWSREDMIKLLNINIEPLMKDPLCLSDGLNQWEPWQPQDAADRFLTRLTELLDEAQQEDERAALVQAFSRLPDTCKAALRYPITNNSSSQVEVRVDTLDGWSSVKGIVVDGERDADGFNFDATFTIFSITENGEGKLTRCNGGCHVQIL